MAVVPQKVGKGVGVIPVTPGITALRLVAKDPATLLTTEFLPFFRARPLGRQLINSLPSHSSLFLFPSYHPPTPYHPYKVSHSLIFSRSIVFSSSDSRF